MTIMEYTDCETCNGMITDHDVACPWCKVIDLVSEAEKDAAEFNACPDSERRGWTARVEGVEYITLVLSKEGEAEVSENIAYQADIYESFPYGVFETLLAQALTTKEN